MVWEVSGVLVTIPTDYIYIIHDLWKLLRIPTSALPVPTHALPVSTRALPQLYRSETQFGIDFGTPETVKPSKSFRNDWNMFIHALVMAGERLGGSRDPWWVGERSEIDFFAPARFSGIWERADKPAKFDWL